MRSKQLPKYLVWALLCYLALPSGCMKTGNDAEISGREAAYSAEEMIEIGKQIYRQGVMADGEPVEATVMGGIVRKQRGARVAC